MGTKYDNIPVSKERQTYLKVQMIAESKGFGKRGAGAMIDYWVARELPECEHPKTAVDIQIFPNQVLLASTNLHRNGWLCATCNRVYQRIEKLERLELESDPYGQAGQALKPAAAGPKSDAKTNKKSSQRPSTKPRAGAA